MCVALTAATRDYAEFTILGMAQGYSPRWLDTARMISEGCGQVLPRVVRVRLGKTVRALCVLLRGVVMSRDRRVGVLVAASVLSIAIGSGFALTPATGVAAKKDSAASESSAAGRVMPLPAGKWGWGANFGVAGPMWSSGQHTGQDLSATAGTPILAAAAGIVVFVGNGGPYGNLTQIQHPDGVQTWYAHQSEIRVKVGDRVRPGSVIGSVGSTGNSTGAHLHFEVRIGTAFADPRAWLGGAPAVPAAGGVEFDPALADQLRGELAEADAEVAREEQEVAGIRAKVAAASKKKAVVDGEANQARAAVAAHVREVYKAGVDPQWLLQADALTSGNLDEYADRAVMLDYSNNAQNQLVLTALAAIKKVEVLQAEISGLEQQAQDTLDKATLKMNDLQARLGATEGVSLVGTQFDGKIPPGGTAAAKAATKFAIAQVGNPFSAKDGTGPEFSRHGLVWQAWKQAGVKWPLQSANTQALNRKWVVPVEAGQEKPGDLVFWRLNNATDLPGRIDHVGLVVNPDKGVFVHSSSARTGVELNNYKTSSYYSGPAMFGRVVGAPKS